MAHSANFIGGAGGGGRRGPSYMGNPLPFDIGNRVALIRGEGYYTSPEENPLWGKNGEYIAGTVISILDPNRIVVRFDNGKENEFELNRCGIESLELAPKPKGKGIGIMGGPKVELDTTQLEKLIIDPEVKIEIVALLQQHKHSKKIFEDWGLGEVIEYGRGMTLMFHGGPGTGKTFGARCIAKALGKELLVIGAAEIQTSEPGGANRNIQQAFETAAAENKVLFLDECDSLISNRANLGMILASEINTLLTEIEKSESVVILATNRIADMDSALERRLSLIIEFPMPTVEQREAIWKGLIPKKMPVDEDVVIKELAAHTLSGGLIKNVVLQAARLAVSDDSKKVAKKHFEKAIERTNSSRNLMGQDRVQRHRDSVGVGMGKAEGGDLIKFLDEEKAK